MPVRVAELCDELTRTGNLFILLSTDQAGMSYIRVLPASEIEEIISKPNDIEQPVSFQAQSLPRRSRSSAHPRLRPAHRSRARIRSSCIIRSTALQGRSGENQILPLCSGGCPVIPHGWKTAHRLNRYRNAFLYVVQAKFTSEAHRKARQTALNANPPQPGSILVADENEKWSAIHPRLECGDAEKDGLALKKMISAGAGMPLHFLAEPESATRTTAEEAGGPTYRHFEQRQGHFVWMMQDILEVVLTRRAKLDKKLIRQDRVLDHRRRHLEPR